MKSETSFSLPLNRHGHMTIAVTGLGLTSEEEMARFGSEYRVSGYASAALSAHAYNDQHRLTRGECYRLVIVRSERMRQQMTGRYYSVNAMREYREFASQFKYQFIQAEAAFRLREMLTDEQLFAMGIASLLVAHEPILVYVRHRVCFHVVHHSVQPTLGAGFVHSLYVRPGVGAVAFLDANP